MSEHTEIAPCAGPQEDAQKQVMREFMPIILGHPEFRIPWALIAPHEAQAQANHYQSLEKLAHRGGLSFCEAAAIMEDRKWSKIVWPEGSQQTGDPARAYLERLIFARSPNPDSQADHKPAGGAAP